MTTTRKKLRLKLIDLAGGLTISNCLHSIRQQQFLPLLEMNRIREEKYRQLFATAKESTVFYKDFHSPCELPVLTKRTVYEREADFFSSLYKGKLIKKSTSGSTGTPFIYYCSANAQSMQWAGLLQSWEITGYQFGDPVAFIAGSALVKKGFKNKVFYKLMNIRTYPAAIMTDEVIEEYVSQLRTTKTKLIYGYAMAINIIADYINKKNLTPLTDLCGVVCTAEMLLPAIRANIEKAFGATVFDQYGCNEAGISAFECQHHSLHLISSRCMYQINEEGALISTDLANDAFIMMKYDTGDLVEFSDAPCACGRNFPVIKKITGRTADVITDRQNKKVHCAYFNFLFKDDQSVKQFQVLFDDKAISLNLMVDSSEPETKYQCYLNSMKAHLDFDVYKLEINKKFYTNKNLKHTFLIDKRKLKELVEV